MKRILSFIVALAILMPMLPQLTQPAQAEETPGNPWEGKTVSILGDSISTLSGVSNNSDYNSTIGNNAVYYSAGSMPRASTWWQQAIDALEMELLVNNSWSGSCVLHTRAGTVGAYVDRCVQLHNDTTGEEPDVIVVFLGTNDFSYYQSTLGTADIDYDVLITADGYAAPTTTCEAYAIMLDKMISRYPNAEIYCMGMTARRSPDKEDSYADVGQPTAFNAELKQIIEHFGVTYVDLENCGIDADAEIFDTYMGDGRVHPNALGMDKITEALVSAMLGRDVTLIDVSADYTGVVSSNPAALTLSGMAYSATLTPMENYSDMTVTVTMGGVDITDDCYAGGVIRIPSVTGDIVITATATRAPQSFLWEYQDGEMVSTGDTENVLTKLNGSCADGVFTNTRYQLAGDVILRHDLPWALEWKGEGTGGFMLAGSSNAAAAPFFFRRAGNYLNAFGDHDGSQYNNYGLTYADGAANHTYRLENRIADDGSNMVYLLVDGEEIGPMTGYFVGGTDKGTTGDWISGQDFTFRYIGTSSHPLTNYAMEYLSVTECTHTYENGLCTHCGKQEPVAIAPLWQEIPVSEGQLTADGEIVENEIYGYVVNYALKKGHTLSISNTDYVFSVRKLENGDYSTLLKSANTDSYTATEDMTVGMLIRKPDQSAMTAEDFTAVTIVDSRYNMIGVEGYEHAFTVEAETIDGGTATTRAAIFLPDSYSEYGSATRLIVMTNGLHGHLTDSVWNANTADDVGVMKHYLDNDYAVIVVNNTANKTSSTPDLGNPQLISSYWKAYEYVQAHFNVEEMFSIHSRSQGTFAAMRLMREHPELVKCAVMCGAVLSIQSRFSQAPAFIAGRYGFDDTTGATWEADKVVGYDPYTDVNGLEYDLPPTFWMLAEADATTKHLSVIEKIENHGNDVTQALYTDTDHSGVCRLNTDACKADSLAFLEKYQDAEPEHRFCAWETVKEAGCTEAGEMRRYCADCSHYETMEIPALSGHVFETSETVCDICGARFDVTSTEITVIPGQFYNESGEWLASDIYGCVIGYELKAGHTLSISNTDYVFAVRVLIDGSYTTMVKDATSDAFTAEEDMIIAVRVRKPDKSALTEEELTSIVLIDTYRVPHTHTYENGFCTGCGAEEPAEAMPLRYDDHVDMTGKTVEIIDAGTPTSYQVGYGVEENTVLDTAVVTMDGNTLVATGIGTAKVCIDGVLYKITVEAAPISLLLLIGQSNMQGSEGNANQSIVCPDGMVYSTYGDRYTMTVSNATNYAPSALTGAGSTVNVNGTTSNLENWPVYLLNEAGAGKAGPDSGYAYEWVQQTGEKVWIVNAAHGGTSITTWQDGATQYEECVSLFKACQETLRKEIAAGHFTLSHTGYFWCQGCSDETKSAEWYVNKFLSMHESLNAELAADLDGDGNTDELEFANITITLAGHVNKTGYRYEEGLYDATDSTFFMTYEELEMRGQRVAQYWLAANPDYPEINMVCNIGENWVTMPDGTDGVADYFQSHYENGTVDYETQVQQSASWYTPATPKAVKDSIHYNQIGYNEVGREAARNTLILLGEIADSNEETTVRFVDWTGYREVSSANAVVDANPSTLIVPIVYPCYRAKNVSYSVSDGLSYEYFDLLASSEEVTGTLNAVGAVGTVTVEQGHCWSDWETIAEPSADGPGLKRRYCACGETQEETVNGIWQTTNILEYLQDLPDHICAGINLWSVLEHDDTYYIPSKSDWGYHSSRDVPSVTIPLNGGDHLFATAFGPADTNGHGTANGIRVTFFGIDGMIKTMTPSETYAEFTKNGGYLIAPEGTVAVNIPMWGDVDTHEIYILNRAHTYSNGLCTGCGGSVLDGGYTAAVPENQGVQNAIDRAYSLTDVEWTPVANVPGVQKIDGVYTVITFEAGKTYKGIPYSGVTANDCYVGLNVSLESYLTALENENSVLYTENLNSTNKKAATYYGTVCSKFVQYALNVPGSYNTNNVANIPGMQTIALPGEYTVDQIKLGDVIVNTATHTTICTGILYDNDGNVAFIEVSEAVSPLCRRLYWSVEEFYEHFAEYRLCRYDYIGETPAVEETQVEDSYALMPRFGDRYNYKTSSTKGVVDILESGYHKAVILRDGVVVDEIALNGATSFKFDRTVPGYLEMYLEKEDGTRSGSVYACVVKSSVSVEDASQFVLGKLTVDIDGSCGTPLYVQVGSAHAIFCNVEGQEGTVEITFPFSKVSSQKVRVAYQNEYGIYLSSWVSFTAEENPSDDPLLSQGKYWNGYNITPSSPTPVVQENKVGYWSYTMVPVEENTTYYSVGATRLWYLDANGDPISTYNAYKDSDIPFQFTTPAGTAYVSIAYSPNLVEQGTETLVHVHTYENGICTGCGAEDPDSYIPGDINGDGVVNNKDLTRLFQYLSDYEVEVVEAALDVNGDGAVNNKDLTRLFQYLSDYPVEIF